MKKKGKILLETKRAEKYLAAFFVLILVFILFGAGKDNKMPQQQGALIAQQQEILAESENDLKNAFLAYLSVIKDVNQRLGGVIPFNNQNTPEQLSDAQDSEEETSSYFKSEALYRFLLIGDSFMAVNSGVGESLEKELLRFHGVDVKRFGKIFSGLVDVEFFDWYKKASQLSSDYQPNFVVILLGNNDVSSFKQESAQTGIEFFEFGTIKWREAYRQKVRDFLNIFKKEGATVYWIGLSMMRDEKFSSQIEELNEIYEQEIKNFSNVHFIPTWDLLSDGNGSYAQFLPDQYGRYQPTRINDGIHLTHFSGAIIAVELLKEVQKTIDLQPKQYRVLPLKNN